MEICLLWCVASKYQPFLNDASNCVLSLAMDRSSYGCVYGCLCVILFALRLYLANSSDVCPSIFW